MRRVVRIALLASLLAACSRDLGLPAENRLAIDPVFATVAPRGELPLTATGGSGGYRFAFAQGGRLSGADSTIGDTTGVYRAGGDGSAQDIVSVTDAAGSTAQARITVTARITASPPVAYLSPGGSLAPVITGGSPPYAYALVRDAGSTGTLLADTYTAGAEGDVVDRMVVTDSTLDPDASTTIVIHVGPRVRLYPPSASVAPREPLPFVALGGEPPYTFSLSQVQSGVGPGAPSVSPDGTYVAGTNAAGGTQHDVVRVTDGLGQIAESDVQVGPPLTLALAVSAVEPGVPVQLVAAGGKPPYTFEFEPKGDRSHGKVDSASGMYTPGVNYGAVDLLQVRDVTATVAKLAPAPLVGAARFDARAQSWRCVVADVSGDGRDDVAVLRWQPNDSNALVDLTTHLEPDGLPASNRTYWLPPGLGTARALAADLDGDGHDELWFLESNRATPLVPDLGGDLSLGTARTLPVSAQFAPIAIAGGMKFYSTATCTAAGPRNGIWVFDWMAGGNPGAATCIGVPWTTGRTISTLAAGDMNGDGYADLAWTEPIDGTGQGRRLLVAFGNGAGTFAAVPDASLLFPDPGSGRYWENEALFMDPEGGLQIFQGGVGALVAYAPYAYTRAIALWHVGSTSVQVVDPFGATSGSGASGFRIADGVVVAWTYSSPTLAGYAWDPAGAGTFASRGVLPTPTPLADGVGSVCLADLDGDGTSDLVAASAASGMVSVYRGEGGGTYGTRARFVGPSTPDAVAVGDVDGDGVADVLVGTGTPGLALLWGGAHQLAAAGETRLALAPRGIALGDWLGTGGRSALVADDGGNLAAYPISAAGTIGGRTSFTNPYSSMATFGPSAITPARFDGDQGLGFWGVAGGGYPGINNYYAMTFARNGATSFQFAETYPPNANTYRCAIAPVAKADGGGILRTKDVVELCTTDWSGIGLWRAGIQTRNPLAFASCAFDNPVCSWGASAVTSAAGTGTATHAGIALAGTLADGAAVFVANTGSATANASAWALVVRAPAVDGQALASTWVSLGTVAGSVDSAALGALNGDAFPDLAVRAGGKVYAFLGSTVGATGSYTAKAPVAAAGRIVGIQPLAVGVAGDVLMLSGEDLVPVANDGAGNLH